MEPTVPTSGQLRKAYTYILNQEKYLRVFLEDGEVPICISPGGDSKTYGTKRSTLS